MQSKEKLTSKGSCSCELREQKGDARTTKVNHRRPNLRNPLLISLHWEQPAVKDLPQWARLHHSFGRRWMRGVGFGFRWRDGEIEHYRFGGKICKSGGFYVYFYLDLIYSCISMYFWWMIPHPAPPKKKEKLALFCFLFLYHDLKIRPHDLVVSDVAAGWKDEKLKESTRNIQSQCAEALYNWTRSPKNGSWIQRSRSVFRLYMESKADIRKLIAGSLLLGVFAISFWLLLFRDFPSHCFVNPLFWQMVDPNNLAPTTKNTHGNTHWHLWKYTLSIPSGWLNRRNTPAIPCWKFDG